MNLRLFVYGWLTRSTAVLDYAGCPVWLVKKRCPVTPGWGTRLNLLAGEVDPGLSWVDEAPLNDDKVVFDEQ